MKNKFLKMALLGGALCTLSSSAYSSSMTATQEVVAASNLCTSLSNLATTAAVAPTDLLITDLDGSSVGTFALSAQRFFKHNAIDDTLTILGSDGTSWYTAKSDALGASRSATFTLTFGGVTKDGASATTDTDLLEMVFTRTGGTVTRAQILAFLNNINWTTASSHAVATSATVTPSAVSTTALFTGNSTSWTSTSALPTGWSAKIIRGQTPGNGATAIASLMPIAGTLTLPLTPVSGTVGNYVASVNDFSVLNTATSSLASSTVTFINSSLGYELPMSFYGGKFPRTGGWWAKAVEVLAAGSKLSPSTGLSSTALVPSSVDYVRRLAVTTDTAVTATDVSAHASSLASLLADRFGDIMGKAAITYADGAAPYTAGALKAQVQAANPEILGFGFARDKSGWRYESSSVSGATVTFNARYADAIDTTPSVNPVTKAFTCTLSGMIAANTAYRFVSGDGDSIWFKVGTLGTFTPVSANADATSLRGFVNTALTASTDFVPALTLEQIIALV